MYIYTIIVFCYLYQCSPISAATLAAQKTPTDVGSKSTEVTNELPHHYIPANFTDEKRAVPTNVTATKGPKNNGGEIEILPPTQQHIDGAPIKNVTIQHIPLTNITQGAVINTTNAVVVLNNTKNVTTTTQIDPKNSTKVIHTEAGTILEQQQTYARKSDGVKVDAESKLELILLKPGQTVANEVANTTVFKAHEPAAVAVKPVGKTLDPVVQASKPTVKAQEPAVKVLEPAAKTPEPALKPNETVPIANATAKMAQTIGQPMKIDNNAVSMDVVEDNKHIKTIITKTPTTTPVPPMATNRTHKTTTTHRTPHRYTTAANVKKIATITHRPTTHRHHKTTTAPTTTKVPKDSDAKISKKPKKPTITFSVDDNKALLQIPHFPRAKPTGKRVNHHNDDYAIDDAPPQHQTRHRAPELTEPATELLLDNTGRNGHRRYVILLIVLIFALPMIFGLVNVCARRMRNYWYTRHHYRRMDFLVDGMYNC